MTLHSANKKRKSRLARDIEKANKDRIVRFITAEIGKRVFKEMVRQYVKDLDDRLWGTPDSKPVGIINAAPISWK